MPRDYKHRANRAAKKKKTAPAWLWVMVGLLLGVFAMGLVWLKMATPQQENQWLGAKPDREPKRVEPTEKIDVVPPHQPRFEFYDKLKKQEISVPNEQLELRKGLAGADPTARYVIQVASFIKAADADRLKAELALIGIEIRINKVKVSAGSVRYRVLAGPYLGKSSLEKARKRLRANGYGKHFVRALQ